MKYIHFQKDIAPHLLAVLTFMIVSVILYYPIILENKTFLQNDINQGAGAGSEIVEYREHTGEEVLWTNSMFGGMPTYLISLRWAGSNFLNEVQRIITLYLPGSVRENFLAFIAFYVLLLAFGVRPYIAIAGALAYGLSTFYVVSIEAGHLWKVRAIAYIPFVLAGFRLVFHGRRFVGFVLATFALAMEINANHLQITYYLLLITLIYGAVQLIESVRRKRIARFAGDVGLLALAAILAVAINLGKIWTTMEYSPYSIRGASELRSNIQSTSGGLDRDYAFQWSSGKWESLTMLIPHLYGGASMLYTGKDSELSQVLRRNNAPADQIAQLEAGYLGYWGAQPGTAGPFYLGAIVCFLFVLALYVSDKTTISWLVGASVLGIVLSWGHNFQWFNYFMFDHFPGYNKFRAVTMTVTMPMLCIPLLAFYGLEQFMARQWDKKSKKMLLSAFGITAAATVLAGLFTSPPDVVGEQIPRWFAEAVHSDRKDIILADTFRSLFFVAAAFAVVYFYKGGRIGTGLFPILLVALAVLDLGLVDKRYVHAEKFVKQSRNTFFTETEADKEILKDDNISYRVFNLQNPFNEARTSLYHKSIGGYHGAKLRRYQDLIEHHLAPELQQIIQDQSITRENTRVLSMLNTRYFLAGSGKNAVIRNPYALGNAWFVEDVAYVESPDEEIEKLAVIDPATTAVIDRSQFGEVTAHADTSAQIILEEYQPNRLVYSANTATGSLAVFSEIYYPKGWHATIDGTRADILRVNYVLRALEVPPGTHTIEFRFEPKSYTLGNKISYASIFVYIGLLAGGLVVFYRRKRSTDEDQA
jgi:hypothetical protein